MTISADRLREMLSYDPETGLFTWLVYRKNKKGQIGSVAGCPNTHGYIGIKIDGVLHLAHRLAFLYMTGFFPNDEVDHKDLNKANNSWDNLRDADRSQNTSNMGAKKTNKLGIKGVCLVESGKYLAKIQVNKKQVYLGRFVTIEEASAAYAKAANDNFGEFARVA